MSIINIRFFAIDLQEIYYLRNDMYIVALISSSKIKHLIELSTWYLHLTEGGTDCIIIAIL